MIENSPLVSVIIPLYNHKNYIKTAIESIVSQSYPNIEIIVIDDGSTDNSSSVVEEIITKSSKSIKLIKKHNEGITKTLNLGISLSCGEYISLLASDDYLLPDSITSRVDYLDNHTEKLAVFGDAVVVDSNGNEIYSSAIEKNNGRKKYLQIDKLLSSELVFRWCVPGPVFMAKRSLYETIGLYDENILIEDWDFYLRAACENLLGFIDKSVAAYRIHDFNSSITRSNENKYLESFVKSGSKNINNYYGLAKLRLILFKHRLHTVLFMKYNIFKFIVNGVFAPVCFLVSSLYSIYALLIYLCEKNKR
jgi:glycosyltransferase involved in cell wall biosynthesis